jgi:hypothetical protein
VVLDSPVTDLGYGELPEAGLVDTMGKGTRLTVVGYGATDFEVGGGPQEPVYLDVRHRATVKLINTNNRLGEMFIKTREASAGLGGEGTAVCAGVGYAQRVDLPEVLDWIYEEFGEFL